MGGFHLHLILSAQTTIEFHGNWSKRKKKGGWKNPYSAGSWKKNWEMIYGTRYWSFHNADDSSNGEEQYRYRGCWGVLLAMMPSRREPEFLPFVYQGQMIRRRKQKQKDTRDSGASEDDIDGEIDAEAAFRRRPVDANKAEERIV